MAAAVADYTPAQGAEPQKIAKTGEGADAHADARATSSPILARACRRTGGPILPAVGFAAETHDVVAHARAKLSRKQIDFIVANDVARADAGFEADTNAVTLVSPDDATELPLRSKRKSPAAFSIA